MGSVSLKKIVIILGTGVFVGAGLGFLILFGLNRINPIQALSETLSDNSGPSVGAPAPGFVLSNLEGENISLEEFRGKPVMLNFWATWCGPCVLEMPIIQKYYKQFDGKFEVFAINAGEPENEVSQFSEDIGVTFNVLLDPGAKIQERYLLRGYPTSYFIDRDGVIRANHIGLLTETQLESYLKQLGVGP
jgi:thiol-disulfide isomerase/thioredoxin